MELNPRVPIIFLLVFLFTSTTLSSSTPADVSAELLSVPSSAFASVAQSAMADIQSVLSIISDFSGMFGDERLSNAVADCNDLLGFSSDQLEWSLSTAENPKGKVDGAKTGNHRSDLSTWLSAAMGNQDTCIQGFDGTDGVVKQLVAGGLYQVTSLVGQLLQMVRQVPFTNFPATARNNGRKLLSDDFPTWVAAGDRKLLQAPVGMMKINVTVAKDGTGNFSTLLQAVNAAPDKSNSRFVIYVKRGVYKENVEIKKKKWNLMMIGDGMGVTVISGNRNYVDGWTTFRSPTFAVSGPGFIAKDLTFENTAGPTKHQAVALRSDSDLSAFYRCGIHGYQDTLYAHSLRQFYRECHISGTVDFIFGNGATVIQNCQITARNPLPNQKNSITAQGRKDPFQNTGFSIQFSNISADYDLAMSLNNTQTYLGRPWKQYSRTIIMQSYMGSLIRPEGWLEWQGDFALSTLYYAEYMNFGPGASLSRRVKWPGYHPFTDPTQAKNYTVGQFIDGDLWLPATGVRYTSDLKQ